MNIDFIKWSTLPLLIVFLAGTLTLFIFSIDFMKSGSRRLLSNPHVFELRSIETKINFGSSPQCEQSECWILDSFNDNQWQKIKIPSEDFKKFNGYKENLNNGHVYYRIKINIPNELIQLDKTLSFSIGWILLKEFTVFLNGHPIQSAEGLNTSSAFTQINIPRELLRPELIFVIKGKYNENDLGIFHRGQMLIGPQYLLGEQKIHSERVMVTSRLLWILPFGTIFFLFAILFIFVKEKASYFNALIFTLAALVTQLLKSDFEIFMSIPFTLLVAAFVLVQTIAVFTIFRFFVEYYKIKIDDKQVATLVVLTFILDIILIYQFHNGSSVVNFVFLTKYIQSLYLIVIGLAFISGMKSVESNRKRGRTPFLIFMGLYLSLLLYFLFTEFNYTWDPFLDLIICIFIALISIFEFGVNEEIIEEQKQKIKEQATDVAIGQTAAMMAHDIRKPFHQLSSFMAKIETFAQNKELLKNAQLELNTTISSVESMISEVMDYSRKSELELAPTSFSKVLQMSLEILKATKIKSNIYFSYNFENKSSALLEPQRFTRVLTNIVSNAIEAISDMGNKQEGIVHFHTYENESHIILEIENNGPSIPEDKIPHLFESFYTEGKVTGTGLGLASCRKTIELHYGSIKAFNKNDSVIFQIRLPRSSHPSIEDSSSLPVRLLQSEQKELIQDSSSSKIIYICDDSIIMQTFLKTNILALDDSWTVKTFKSGEETLLNIESDSPSIVFTDLNLGDGGGKINGYDVIKEAQKKVHQCRFYLISNTSLTESQDKMKELGAKALSLPIDEEILKGILK